MLIPPKRIAMSGGGMLGVAHIGALDVLQARGLLRCVKEYVGISAGAFAALCICIGYTVSELRSINNGFDFRLMQNLEPETMFAFMDSYGLDDGQNFKKLLGVLLRTKGLSPEITFAEFAAQFPERPQLRIYATDVQTCLKKEFSLAATPDVPMQFAVLASASIPLIFTPVREESSGNLFVDGGLIVQSPFHHLTDSERAETLGLTFNMRKKLIGSQEPPNTILGYFQRLYLSVYHHHDTAMELQWGHRIIQLDTGKMQPFHFGATSEEKEELFLLGCRSTEEFLKKGQQAIPARRNSCP